MHGRTQGQGAGFLVAGKGAKYEHDTVSVARGKVAETIEQRQADGWELVDQDQGMLRTKLMFRRPKPPDRTLLWIGVGLAVVAVIVTIGVLMERARGGAEVAVPAPPAATSPAAPTPTTPTVKPTPSPIPTSAEPEPEAGPLWTKVDGPATFQCIAGNMSALVRFDLPAAWPYTDELNAILQELDGRKPVTVLTVVNEYAWDQWSLEEEYEHPILTGSETTSFISLTLETSKGTITVSDDDPDSPFSVYGLLWDTGLIDPDRNVGSKKLRARAIALADKEQEREDFTSNLVIAKPITHLDSARAEFLTETGRYYPECVKAP
ncbi:MAG: hypothetical protein QM628_15695 [Propionicimonas sp.]